VLKDPDAPWRGSLGRLRALRRRRRDVRCHVVFPRSINQYEYSDTLKPGQLIRAGDHCDATLQIVTLGSRRGLA
jgi:hypothetical protein